MISVVIAAFNGETHIMEQLESIRYQQRKADEVLICDDRSTDRTRELCRAYIAWFGLSNWRVVENKERLGYYKNFMSGLAALNGDILILCDQDDIWCSDKIKTIEEVMDGCPDIWSLTTTFSRFDNSGKVLNNHVIHPHSKQNSLTRLSGKDFFRFHNYLGMSMAIRKDLLQMIHTDNPNHITHDILLNMHAVKAGKLYHLDRVLTRRRSYDLSTSNQEIKNEIDREYQGNAQLQYLAKKIQLLEPGQFGFPKDDFGELMLRFRENYKRRYEYVSQKSIAKWAKNAINLCCYESVRQYMKDLSAILREESKP